MFREQLHESLDNISPSPELLDRISAMMQEEVSRPRPPISINAARYGGIAAAVLITAGAALAAVQMNAGKNDITSESAPAYEEKKAVADGAVNGIAAKAAEPEPAAFEEAAPEAAAPEAAATEAAAEETIYSVYDGAAGDNAFFAAGAETTTYAAAEEPDAPGGGAPDEQVEAAARENNISDFVLEAPEEDEKEEDAAELYIAQAAEDYDILSFEDGDDDLYSGNYAEDDETAAAAPSDSVSSAVVVSPIRWADPAAGEGTAWDAEPTDAKFYMIPLELQICADGAVEYTEDGYIAGDRWKEYVEANHTDFVELTSIDKGINVFTFIKYFNINGEYARDALMNQSSANNRYTEEEADALISGDLTVIARTFASKWAVVKGEKLYSPYWLENHSFDEWQAEGITPDDIRSRYDELTNLPVTLTNEEFRTAYKERFDRFIAGQPDNKKIERRSAPVSAADNENAIAGSVVTLTNDLSDKDMSQKESAALNKEASARYAKALDKLLDDADAVPLPYSAIELSKYESMAVVSFGGVYGKCGLLGDTVYVYTERGRSGALVLTKDPYVRVWLSDNAAKELYNITCDGSSYQQ